MNCMAGTLGSGVYPTSPRLSVMAGTLTPPGRAIAIGLRALCG